MTTLAPVQYGRSEYYLGERGKEYFEFQNRWGPLIGEADAWKFTPWIGQQDTVLDFGCGGGWLLSYLSAASKCGVEINPAARNCAKERGLEVYSEVSQIPAERRFSRIISHHCLEHVPYPIAALRSLRDRLTSEGLLVLVVPLDDWRVQRDCTGKDVDHHLHTWTPRLLANTLVESGFHTQRLEVLSHAWPPNWKSLYAKLPERAFHWVCQLWGIARKRRQLRAIASPVQG